MRILLSAVVLTAITSACSESPSLGAEAAAIKEELKQYMKDPESATFKSVTMNANKDRGCIVWNAKNSFGGYGEWNISSMQNAAGRWKVDDIEAEGEQCTQRYFDAVDEYNQLRKKLQDVAAKPEASEILVSIARKLKAEGDVIVMLETESVLKMNQSLRDFLNAL